MADLQLDILPASQRRLWDALGDTPDEFILYGGTAIALRLGHRESIDFDFFCFQTFDPLQLYERIPYLRGATILQSAPNTLTCLTTPDDPVQISFFGIPKARQVRRPMIAPDNKLKLASLTDLAGMKAATVQRRAEAKDYIDIDALMRGGGIGLPTALAAASVIYGAAFHPQSTLKALCFFDEPELASLPDALKRRLVQAVAAVDLDRLPVLVPEDEE